MMIGINAYYVHEYVKEPPELSDEETALLKAMDGQIALNEFNTVLQAGTWQTFEEGETLEQEAAVYLVASGVCDVYLDGCSLRPLGPGSVVGEEQLFTHGAGAGVGGCPALFPVVVAQDTVRCLCLPREQLQKNGELMEALQGAFAAALAAKVLALSDGLIPSQHSALQELADGATDAETAAILGETAREYGLRHGILEPESHVMDSRKKKEALLKAASNDSIKMSRSPSGVEDRASVFVWA